jgi:O-antigen ligase
VVPLLAIAGIVMTGTRGAMLAAAALVALFAPVIVWMWMQRLLPAQRGLRIAAASVVPVAALVMVAGAAMLLPLARERIDRGVAEVRSALRAEEYRSDTGARVLMMRQAARAIAARPLHGVGAGGYQAWAITDLREESGKPRKQWPIHRHAHCWALHIGATTGIVGVLLLAGVLVRAMWSGVAGWRAWVRDGGGGAFEGASLSAACGLAGLVLVGAFDVISVNQQTSALLWTLVALCLPMRPQERAGGMEGGAS